MVTVDGAGNVYFFDDQMHRVLRSASGGGLSVVAGSGEFGTVSTTVEEGGAATAQALSGVTAMVVTPSGELVIADTILGRVLSVNGSGRISTIAGGGSTALVNAQTYVPDGTAASELDFFELSGLEVDGDGRLYVADRGYHMILRIEDDGGITLLAADQRDTTEAVGEPARSTRITHVDHLSFDGSGSLVYDISGIVYAIADVVSS
jgi:hypothetical protein